MAAMTPRDQQRKRKMAAAAAQKAGPRRTQTPSARANQQRGQNSQLDPNAVRTTVRDTQRDQQSIARRMDFLRRNTDLASDPMAFSAFEALRQRARRNLDVTSAGRRFFRQQGYDPAVEEAKRQQLIAQSRTNAATMSDNARAGAGSNLARYDQRMGEGQMRALGYDIPGVRAGAPGGSQVGRVGATGPGAMARLGARLSPAERARLDPTLAGGVDQRAAYLAQRDQDMADSRRLAALSQTGVALPVSGRPRGNTPDEQRALRMAIRNQSLARRADQAETTSELRDRTAAAGEQFALNRATAGADIQTERARGAGAREARIRSKVAASTAGRQRELELSMQDAEARIPQAEAMMAETRDPAVVAELERERYAAETDLARANAEAARTGAASTATLAESQAGLDRANAAEIQARARKTRVETNNSTTGQSAEQMRQQIEEQRLAKELRREQEGPNAVSLLPAGEGGPEQFQSTLDDVSQRIDEVGVEVFGRGLSSGTPKSNRSVEYGAIPKEKINTIVGSTLPNIINDYNDPDKRTAAMLFAQNILIDFENQGLMETWAIANRGGKGPHHLRPSEDYPASQLSGANKKAVDAWKSARRLYLYGRILQQIQAGEQVDPQAIRSAMNQPTTRDNQARKVSSNQG